MALANVLRAVFNPLLDFVYPPVCMTCGRMLGDGEDRVCARCWKSFTALDPHGGRLEEMRERFRADGWVADCVSCFSFEKEGRFQEVIHLLKYGGMSRLGTRLGWEIGTRICLEERFSGADCLVPVPLHSLKRRERGYNQCDYLCRGIAGVASIPVRSSFLARKKYTASQTTLSIVERRANVAGAFIVPPKFIRAIEGRTIIVVDDVITTGATLGACARALREHGASCVLAASAGLAA